MEKQPRTDLLIDTDKRCIWHPYTQAKTAPLPIPLHRASGAYLYSPDGTRYFDAISSWWVTTHGHSHPYIAEAIANQAKHFDQAVFADFTHAQGVLLAERLLSALNKSSGKVFYSDNGSTAVETALKMAIQYWFNKAKSDHTHAKRKTIVCFENGYHGDTFGAMSSSGQTPFNTPFHPYLFSIETIPPPVADNADISLNRLKKLLKEGAVAAFIFEPVIQGAAGMKIHSAEILDTMLSLCREHGTLTIADEVMTGFGRTGPLFACNRFKTQPDITCLSKGLTGGFLPLGATVCTQEIYDAFYSDSLVHAFLHGHSYCGNPITCAAALASMDLYDKPDCLSKRQRIEKQHRVFVKTWGTHPSLKRCEVIGTILVLEYFSAGKEAGYFSSLKARLASHFLKQGIYVRPIGNVLYFMPPYCTEDHELDSIYAAITQTLEHPL